MVCYIDLPRTFLVSSVPTPEITSNTQVFKPNPTITIKNKNRSKFLNKNIVSNPIPFAICFRFLSLFVSFLDLLNSTKNGVQLVDDESIKDTLLDLHNYAAMGLMII